MDIEGRIEAFASLGKLLKEAENQSKIILAIEESIKQNPWFNKENILYALHAIGNNLQKGNINQWLSLYPDKEMFSQTPQKIAVIMAGNIPIVGFHDFLSILMTGNRVLAKLSSNDQFLFPAIAELLLEIEPSFKDYIELTTQKVSGFDAIIATGSDNTSRYFEYYFGKYPHIIRKNRNSVAILNGKEDEKKLSDLSDDIFLYYGLGCRNVSKLFVPEGYDFASLLKVSQKYSSFSEFSKFRNNYDYRKTVCLMNNIPFMDGGFFILQENEAFSSPLSVLHFEYYRNMKDVVQQIEFNKDKLQCVVSESTDIYDRIPMGESQKPQLWDYADHVDTLLFLLNREGWKIGDN